MRLRFVLLTFWLVIASLASPVMAANRGSATLSYQNRVQSIVMSRVFAALIPRFQQLPRAGSGAVGARFRVLASGQVESVTVTRRHPASFVNSTCSRVISSTRFPPLPSKVIHEQGHPYVDVTTEIRVN